MNSDSGDPGHQWAIDKRLRIEVSLYEIACKKLFL